jgi:hypothetical protein
MSQSKQVHTTKGNRTLEKEALCKAKCSVRTLRGPITRKFPELEETYVNISRREYGTAATLYLTKCYSNECMR